VFCPKQQADRVQTVRANATCPRPCLSQLDAKLNFQPRPRALHQPTDARSLSLTVALNNRAPGTLERETGDLLLLLCRRWHALSRPALANGSSWIPGLFGARLREYLQTWKCFQTFSPNTPRLNSFQSLRPEGEGETSNEQLH
jgi:hypothetical protein